MPVLQRAQAWGQRIVVNSEKEVLRRGDKPTYLTSGGAVITIGFNVGGNSGGGHGSSSPPVYPLVPAQDHSFAAKCARQKIRDSAKAIETLFPEIAHQMQGMHLPGFSGKAMVSFLVSSLKIGHLSFRSHSVQAPYGYDPVRIINELKNVSHSNILLFLL